MGTRTGLVGIALALGIGGAAEAQQVRVSGVSTFQYLDVRPLSEDSVAATDVTGSGLLRRSPDGYVVRCVTGDAFCRYRRPAETNSTVPVIQDLTISAWGFGRGLRLFARVRGRAMVVGDDAFWPRADDVADVQAVYLELDRETFRARVGRQWRASGLGFYNFDGASFSWQPVRGLSAEAFGGWSLLRGVNEPITSGDLAAIEPFAPDARSYLIGGRLSYRPRPGAAISATYQREIRDDRAALYSERAAVDGVLRVGSSTLQGEVTVDWSTADVNEASLRWWLPRTRNIRPSLYVRHHKPFFDLWTIWGAFTPLSYDEAGVRASWERPASPFAVQAWLSGRRYRGAEAEALFGDFRNDGWRVGLAGQAQVARDWQMSAQYRADLGFGAASSDLSARIQRAMGDRNHFAINGAVFQRLYEFRVDDGTVLAIGGDLGWQPGPRLRVSGNFTAYRHLAADEVVGGDWTQLRGSLRLEWMMGVEPAARRLIGRAP